MLNSIEFANGATIAVGPGGGCDFDSIQAGIDAAGDGDTILVASGEYIITEPITFRGKAITVQSEVGRDQTTIRMGTPTDPKHASVVVFENNETAASVLEGFTISGGQGSWVPTANASGGGGILFNASSGTVSNCAIVQNKGDYGAGVGCADGASPTLFDCIISENSASVGLGGGVYAWYASAILIDCIISGNSAEADGGGGIACWYGSLVLTRCVILRNTGGYYFGGGVYAGHGSAALNNCIVARNTVALGGGGVACSYPDATLTISNCTIWGNSGGASHGGGGVLCRRASATVTSSIIWGNTSAKGHEISVQDPASKLDITYSNVAGGQAEISVEGG